MYIRIKFFRDCKLVSPLSVSNNLYFPSGHPLAAYFFCLVFPSIPFFPLSFSNNTFQTRLLRDRIDPHAQEKK
jgi:hypothetical protein